MHASRDQQQWTQKAIGFAVPTNARQTTLVGADDWRDETGLATWLANLVRYTLYSETVGIVLRSERARRPRLVATAGVAPGRAAAWWDQLCADIPDLEAGNESISRSTGLHAVRAENDTHVPDATTRRVVRLVLPLLVSERQLGAMIVEFRFGKRVMPDVLLRTRALAHLVALALDHGRLMDEREAWANTVGQLRRDSENTEAALMQIVHELRGPLTTMKLGTQIAQRQLKKVADSRMVTSDSTSAHVARAATALALADHNANMAERLLSDLADITRIRVGVGVAETHTKRCDLGEIVHNTVAGQRLMWRRRIIHLESPTEAVPVVADAERIAQVVGNYLSNALKYSPNVQPVEVRLEYGDGEARVAVCDHGVGIAPECQQRVWERFYRTSGSRSYSADGLGVGLFICRQLVEQMGGRVGLESVLGEGSTFWFTVPLATS
jgi:signal transduction histidine kinase